MFTKLLAFALLALYVNSFTTYGCDISAWQGDVNFSGVKNSGKTFVILRAGTGAGNKDKYFDTNYSKAKAAGLNVGVYWYSYASTTSDGTNEANHVLNVISGKKFEYPIYYDIEESSIFNLGITSTLAKNFCSLLEGRKYFCGIYASKS